MSPNRTGHAGAMQRCLYFGSGSVIIEGVPDDAMAVERGRQTNGEGGAARYRAMKTRGKPPKGG
jgi:bifunctional UDP-N-acetylglucosamine pyrophosphorylase/glucosamine-1-phosphate N-acetyltransferase